MSKRIFKIVDECPIREQMTISRDAKMDSVNGITYFSLGKETSITQECYDTTAIYFGSGGDATFLIGTQAKKKTVGTGDILMIPGGMLCGVQTNQGTVYTEIITQKEIIMNKLVKIGEPMKMKELISYQEGSIANMDIASNSTMKFVLMAFDEGTGLKPHRAPGNAIITALEGKAIVHYEGQDYELNEGENFRFDKNGLHSVTAQGKFKMSLLLVLE